jgi:hypothetical protein
VGVIKNYFLCHKQRDFEHLGVITVTAFEKVDEEKKLCVTIIVSVASRFYGCVEENDRHFEQLS